MSRISKGETTCMNKPAIFEFYPELETKLPWIQLGDFPTPVHVLENTGDGRLWIKRDDKSSTEYGGNKVRKLEFVLADAIKKGCDHIITMGGIGTNHGLATAVFAKKLGLKCTLLLFKQPVNEYVKRNMLLFHKYDAEIIYAKSITRAGIELFVLRRLRSGNAYHLFAGGSSPIGTLGFANAAFELKKQIGQGLLPEPDIIVCPLGSNGTMAGLSLGVQLAGIRSRVIGVQVTESHIGPFQVCTKGTVTKLMKKTLRLLNKNLSIDESRYDVVGSYFGEGYGYPTPEGMLAISLMKERENIVLEPTYTGKTFAAVIDMLISKEYAGKSILYWHTYNSVDLRAQAASVDYHLLPQPFPGFFINN
jgi:1-aminocyclopropane-1-carboxylate deaminase/D-cysteine desulfhydrase-like pyridoxal-dependent ACC family enzyme